MTAMCHEQIALDDLAADVYVVADRDAAMLDIFTKGGTEHIGLTWDRGSDRIKDVRLKLDEPSALACIVLGHYESFREDGVYSPFFSALDAIVDYACANLTEN